MITLKLSLGDTIVSGLTFSSETQIEEIEGYIGIVGTISELAHLIKRSRSDQQGAYSTINEDTSTELTLALIMTADDPSDIEYIQGKYAGLKNIVVELV